MERLNMTVAELWDDMYVIPLYQRNYAWRENEISRLLQDIYDAYKRSRHRNYYIGSLVAIRRTDGCYEVIDGQQRLTTLQLICKIMGVSDSSKLRYDSRPEVERFFYRLFNSGGSDIADMALDNDEKSYRLRDALRIINGTRLGNESPVQFSELHPDEKSDLARYIANKVVIVRTVLPSDTDVAAYFEIMNNRGEQLQEHEIVKARLMNGYYAKDGKKLSERQRTVFSEVWDACSQINVPIQRTLGAYRKNEVNPLFGPEYDSLDLDCLDAYSESVDAHGDGGITIDEILNSDLSSVNSALTASAIAEERYKSVIDFPNFLLVVLKSMDDRVGLNANRLLSEFDSAKPDAVDFLKKLLKYRVLFDRYVIHNSTIDDSEDGDGDTKWEMQRPKKYDSGFDFVNTYPLDENMSDKGDFERIVKQESMLQVTFRGSKYKTWLFDLLNWLDRESNDDVASVSSSALMSFLDEWICSYYAEVAKTDFQESGTDTPHFIFNFIDYLYWVAARKPRFGQMFSHLDVVRKNDFNFHYYNSVEHHWAQSNGGEGIRMDALGNLCLISRRNNSSLNDKAPTAKANVKDQSRLQPKRRIMYAITIDNKMWEKDQIDTHHTEILSLLTHHTEILTDL